MAKALKIVGTVVAVVGIAALAVSTFGASLGISAAVVSAAGTVATVASIASATIAVASTFVKPGFSGGGNALNFVTNPQSGLPYAIGRTRMSGLRIHADTYSGTKAGSKQDIVAFAILLSCGGQIDAIESFRADKVSVSFDSSTGTASGVYADYMAQKVSTGAPGASALTLSFRGGSFPGWTSAHKLSGMTHALWDLRYDKEGEYFTAGVPEPEWVGRWVRVYDPRLDGTYPGGSGSCRALDETTYVFSRNPALHALTWALGRWQNGKRTVGIGAPVENIRVSDFVEAANVADANEWYCGGVNWSTDSKWEVFKRMLQAGGATPTMTGAMIGCRAKAPRVSIATIEAKHILDSLSVSVTAPRRDRLNSIIPRFRSENHEWEVISGSPITVDDYVTADGGLRRRELDLPLVQHESGFGDGNIQAGQLAAYEIVDAREAGPIRFTTGPEFIGLKCGDCVTIDVPEEGLTAQDIVLTEVGFDPATAKMTFTAMTETASKHDFALGKSTTPPPAFSLDPPDLLPPTPEASLWDLNVTAMGDGLPAITVEGASQYPSSTDVVIRFRLAGGDWNAPIVIADDQGTISYQIGPLEGSTQYEAEIAYRNEIGQGPWLSLGTVTTNAPLLPSSQFPTAVPTDPGVGHIYIDETGKKYRFDGRPLLFGGVTITFNGDPIYTSGYSEAQDQAVLFAIEEAQAAQATADLAQAAADAANAAIAQIDDDDIITISEKVEVLIPGAAAFEALYTAVSANAAAAAVSVTTLNTRRTAWLSALAAISPAWNDVSAASPVVRGSLDTARGQYDSELKNVQQLAIEAMTAAKQVVVVPPVAQIVYRDWLGAVKPSQYPRTLTPKVERGGIDIRTSNDVSYSITTTGTITATVNNTTASADKGRITATGGSSGSILLTITVSGVAQPVFTIPFTNQDDNPPTTGGGGGSGNTGGSDSTLEDVTSTSFAAITQQDGGESVFLIDITSGQTINGTAPLTYTKTGTNGTSTAMVAKWQYRLQGSGTWLDFTGSSITGTGAFWNSTDFIAEQGEITANQSKAGLATGTYECQLVGAKSNSAAGNLQVVSGAATVSTS